MKLEVLSIKDVYYLGLGLKEYLVETAGDEYWDEHQIDNLEEFIQVGLRDQDYCLDEWAEVLQDLDDIASVMFPGLALVSHIVAGAMSQGDNMYLDDLGDGWDLACRLVDVPYLLGRAHEVYS